MTEGDKEGLILNELEYTYAVARIRALEISLLTQASVEQLMTCKDEQQCLQFLTEKGWGDASGGQSAEEMLKREEEKIWEVIFEIAPDKSVFDVLSYPKLFHNAKAAVKMVCTDSGQRTVFYEDCAVTGEAMMQIIRNKEFAKLPDFMAAQVEEAYETLLHTGDGQLCDVILDRAALDAIRQAGERAQDAIIREYAESTVAVADIRIAVRCQKTGKSPEFMRRAMAPCRTLNTEALIRAAAGGMDALTEYLLGTSYAGGAEALRESWSAFDRWCDSRMMEIMRPQKYQTFSVGPLVAYILARENEIKTVRIILTGKQNGFSEEEIRERIRETYV